MLKLSTTTISPSMKQARATALYSPPRARCTPYHAPTGQACKTFPLVIARASNDSFTMFSKEMPAHNYPSSFCLSLQSGPISSWRARRHPCRQTSILIVPRLPLKIEDNCYCLLITPIKSAHWSCVVHCLSRSRKATRVMCTALLAWVASQGLRERRIKQLDHKVLPEPKRSDDRREAF